MIINKSECFFVLLLCFLTFNLIYKTVCVYSVEYLQNVKQHNIATFSFYILNGASNQFCNSCGQLECPSSFLTILIIMFLFLCVRFGCAVG